MTAPRLAQRDYFVLLGADARDTRCARRDGERIVGGGGYKNLVAQLLQGGGGLPRPFSAVRARPLGAAVADPETGVMLASEWRITDQRTLNLGHFLGPHGADVSNLLTRLASPFSVNGITADQRISDFCFAFDALTEGLPGATREERLRALERDLADVVGQKGLGAEVEAARQVALSSEPLTCVTSEAATALISAMVTWSVVHGTVRSPFAQLIELIRQGSTIEFSGDATVRLNFEEVRMATLARQVEQAFSLGGSDRAPIAPAVPPAGTTIAAWCGEGAGDGGNTAPFSSTAVIAYDSGTNTFTVACEDAGLHLSITHADMHAALGAQPVRRTAYRLGEHMNSSAPSGYLLSIDQGDAVVFFDSDALADVIRSSAPPPQRSSFELE